MAIHKDDLPISITLVDRFKMYGIEFQTVYCVAPKYDSDKYLKFATIMQNFDLIDQLKHFEYVWRQKNDLLSEEELANIAKFKKYYNSL